MSAVATSACTCVNWQGNGDVRQCPEHFHLFSGSTRLTSVGRIVGLSFPLDPKIPPDVLENAKERGNEVDKLAAAYVMGKLDRIPAGTRNDSRDLFLKFRAWFDAQHFSKVEAQVLLGGEDHGGVLDFRFDYIPHDLKCTYNVEQSARLQVAAYTDLCDVPFRGRIVHVTERFTTPKVVELTPQDRDDWRICLEHFRMIQRRKPMDLERAG